MQWLANLASIVVRPRRTMRRILDAPRDRMIVPLVVLAALSGAISDFSMDDAVKAYHQVGPQLRVLAPLGIIAGILAMLLVFYVGAWVAFVIGRALEGTGSIGAVRSALAWGLAPAVWALLYRIPAMWLREGQPEMLRIGDLEMALGTGCGTGLLDFIVLAAWFVVTSLALAEAHAFSSARGFGTVALCLLAPIVVVAAAVLAM